MATKSSYFLAVLLLANPFMLLVFQNCTPSAHDRNIASVEQNSNEQPEEPEYFEVVNKNLKAK